MTCPRCQHKSQNTENNLILGVRFEEGAPLHKLLRTNTFAGNSIQGRKCDSCHSTNDTFQKVRLGRCPEILVVQLLRFRANGTKKSAKIALTEELDLTPFTLDHKPARYRISSVVDHRGTMDFGHYKAVTLGPRGWEELDDSRVSRISLTDALHPAGSWTPYMIFWTRIDV